MSTKESENPEYGFERPGLFENFCSRAWNGLKGCELGLVPPWDQATDYAKSQFRIAMRVAFAVTVLDIPEARKNTRANLLWFADLQPKEG